MISSSLNNQFLVKHLEKKTILGYNKISGIRKNNISVEHILGLYTHTKSMETRTPNVTLGSETRTTNHLKLVPLEQEAWPSPGTKAAACRPDAGCRTMTWTVWTWKTRQTERPPARKAHETTEGRKTCPKLTYFLIVLLRWVRELDTRLLRNTAGEWRLGDTTSMRTAPIESSLPSSGETCKRILKVNQMKFSILLFFNNFFYLF